MKVDVLSIEGEKTGRKVELPENVFSIEPNEHAVYLAVKQYLAHQRQGTHKVKERNEIVGSTRKIKRQKGTGTARAGDIKNPLFRGGGTIFGPRPRHYRQKLNKKVKKLARRSALASKFQQGDVLVIEDFTFDAPKTAEFASVLQNLNVDQNKTLLITADQDNVLYLSSRNIKTSKVKTASEMNTYDVVYANKILLSEGSIEKIQ